MIKYVSPQYLSFQQIDMILNYVSFMCEVICAYICITVAVCEPVMLTVFVFYMSVCLAERM